MSAEKTATAKKPATKKETTTRKPAAKKATTKKRTRKASTDIVEAEIVTPSEYMSDVARQLAGDYDAEARERELAPIIRAKISGTLASRDKTEYAKMAVDVAAIGQEHVNAAVSGKTDIMKRTSEGIALRTDGAEAMRRDLAALAVTVDGLGGKRSIVSRLFPFFETPEKKLREFQARFQSTEESLQEITNSIRDAAMTMERDADCLDSEASYQYARIHDMAADVQAVRFIRRDAEARVEELRATLISPTRCMTASWTRLCAAKTNCWGRSVTPCTHASHSLSPRSPPVNCPARPSRRLTTLSQR